MHTFFSNLLVVVALLTSLFLIVLILIQRGKGGGLAGAFGGMGGQSAFGTKAGDLFTRITIGVSLFWIVLLVFMVKVLGGGGSAISETLGGAADTKPGVNAPAVPGNQPAGEKTETPAKTPAKSETKP